VPIRQTGAGQLLAAAPEAALTSLAAEFSGGIAIVSIASVTESGLVAPAIAGVLGMRDDGDSDLFEQLVRRIGGRHLLLVLGTFEHLTRAAPMVSLLLSNMPGPTVIVTSRAIRRVVVLSAT